MDLLKHGDDGYRVHSSNQTAEEKILQQADVQVAYGTPGIRDSKSGFYSMKLSRKVKEP